jgi:ESF2/ABP1 family protein
MSELENNNDENNEEDINDINKDIEDNNYDNELTVEELREKNRRSGVLYMSRVPTGMKISELRKFFDDYGMQRCYLVPLKKKIENVDGRKLQGYKEGWIEFSDKIYAKLAEYQLNGKRIGGSKKCPYKDELWNLKYLHKFKWNDLIENLTMAKKMQEKKLKLEIAQSKRENDFIVKNFEKSKKFLKKKKHEEKEDKEGKEDNNNQNIKDYSKYKQKKFIK